MTPQAIREHRRGYPLTMSELAHRIGMSVHAVRSWEQGWRRPGPDAVRKLGVVFGLRAPAGFCPIRPSGCGCRCHGRLPRPEMAVLDMRRRTA